MTLWGRWHGIGEESLDCTVGRGCCIMLVNGCVHSNFGSSFAPHAMGNGMVVSYPHLHTILYPQSYKFLPTLVYDSKSLTTLSLRLCTLHLAFLDFGWFVWFGLLSTFHSQNTNFVKIWVDCCFKEGTRTRCECLCVDCKPLFELCYEHPQVVEEGQPHSNYNRLSSGHLKEIIKYVGMIYLAIKSSAVKDSSECT